jgi:hypothetical protein
VRTADVEDEDALRLGQLDELDAVRRQELAGRARRLAAGVRLELVLLAIVVHRLGPRLERHLFVGRDGIEDAEDRQPDALVLDRLAAENGAARGVARRRLGRGGVASVRGADAAEHVLGAPAALAPSSTSAALAFALPLGCLSAPASLLGLHSVGGEKHRHGQAQNRTCERLHRLVSPSIQ